MSRKTTFEQLCSGVSGYSCDESSMARLTKEESFNDMVFKVITKCETNLIFLPSPTSTIKLFTLDIVPSFTKASVASAWTACENEGYDGMNVLATLDTNNMPETASARYSFSQFIDYVVHQIEAHFMFQKDFPHFSPNALNYWNAKATQDAGMVSCSIILAWKFNRRPIEDILNRSPLSQLNSSVSRHDEESVTPKIGTKNKCTFVEKTEDKRRKTITGQVNTPARRGRKGRPSMIELPASSADDSGEEDTEISFRKKPEEIIPEVRYLKGMTPAKAAEPVQPMEIDDITLGFEKPQPAKGGRKSTARKSLLPDWPDVEKQHILEFFDNLNPAKAEQTRVALTCKFAQMQYDRELPSKLLYQWIQKKGRPVHRTITSFELPEDEQNKATVDLYKQLNPETSDVSRVAFICKFVNMQYGISITSKEFNDILNGKTKKASKRR